MSDTQNNGIFGWVLDHQIDPDATLRQGDLIKFHESAISLQKTGIIVTADCDFAQQKHARLVTLVPVVSVQDLLINYLLPEDCERKRSHIEAFLYRSLMELNQVPREARLPVLRDLYERDQLPNETAILAARVVLGHLNKIEIGEYIALMRSSKCGQRKSESLRDQIRSRGDVMVLPDLEPLGIKDEVAWVRHIWQVPLGKVAIRTSEVAQREGEKVARLDSPFRYRLTQIFSQVFSDIGLPAFSDRIDQTLAEIYHDS